MDGQRQAGNEVLAISHNANLSNGLMFPIDVDGKGRPIDAAWAQERLLNEPLTEIKQVKGTSETHPDLSPNDEFANFEIMNYLIGIDNSSAKLYRRRTRDRPTRTASRCRSTRATIPTSSASSAPATPTTRRPPTRSRISSAIMAWSMPRRKHGLPARSRPA